MFLHFQRALQPVRDKEREEFHDPADGNVGGDRTHQPGGSSSGVRQNQDSPRVLHVPADGEGEREKRVRGVCSSEGEIEKRVGGCLLFRGLEGEKGRRVFAL